jgi:hypothetical protein
MHKSLEGKLMATTFDPISKRIVLDSTFADTREIYSSWKRWVVQGDNLKYTQAFRVVGGDPLGDGRSIPPYLFLLNGWRVRPMEATHTLKIVGGAISVDGGGDPVVRTLGNYQVNVDREVPVAAIGVAEGGGGGSNADAIAAAVIAALQGSVLDANVRKVNGVTVGGQGTEASPWGPQ